MEPDNFITLLCTIVLSGGGGCTGCIIIEREDLFSVYTIVLIIIFCSKEEITMICHLHSGVIEF